MVMVSRRLDVGTVSAPVFIIVVSGSRGITSQEQVWNALDLEWAEAACAGHEQIEFRLGDAAGVDHLALRWARERGFPRTIYFADREGYDAWCRSRMLHGEGEEAAFAVSDWDTDGKSAGGARNAAMIGILEPKYRPYADLLVAIWDGSSRGTRNCMANARTACVPIHQYGGAGPIQFKSAGPRDAELVEWRGELGGQVA